jgi:hypothetical protein
MNAKKKVDMQKYFDYRIRAHEIKFDLVGHGRHKVNVLGEAITSYRFSKFPRESNCTYYFAGLLLKSI